jgi:agmatine/peptidylarginine deiminase
MISTSLIPEWAAQSAVFMAWPYAEGDFTPWLPAVEKTYRHIAIEVARRERLILACRSEEHRQGIEGRLLECGADIGQIRFVVMPYNDVWVRDTAPLSVQAETGVRLLDFRFNGWGGKYEHGDDAAIARRLHESGALGTSLMEAVDFVLEGGSVETDGAGSIMTTTRCLLNPNRNPALSKTQIEAQIAARLGAEQVLWLEHGHAEGDDTDAHIDTLARFCSPDMIAFTACDQPDDPLFKEFAAMAAQLGTFRNNANQPYRLVPLPIPAPIRSEEGDRLPATYANFLIINDAVLVPVYRDPADRVALERLANCFPNREIVPIDCVPLIRQYGSLHCMTMQFPSSICAA